MKHHNSTVTGFLLPAFSAPVANVGVISDTHGLLRPQTLSFLQGSDLILHAGDVGTLDVLEGLQQIAPVIAIKGNIDTKPGVRDLPANERVTVAGKRLYLLHNIKELNLDPVAENIDVVIFGHSHKPAKTVEQGILYLNPGSVGPRRFNLPIAAAKMVVSSSGIATTMTQLPP